MEDEACEVYEAYEVDEVAEFKADEVNKVVELEEREAIRVGLNRRPPEDEDFDEVRMLRKKPSSTPVLAGESLHLAQQRDIELRNIVGFRLRSNESPSHTELQTESELTKKLVTKWN